MGFRSAVVATFAFFIILSSNVGCTLTPTAPVQQMLRQRSLIDLTGLASNRSLETVHITGSPPLEWDRLVTQKTALFTHEQWRSPSARTAVGVIYVRLPLPLSADSLRWFAKREYQHRLPTTRATTHPSDTLESSLFEWRDALGRPWFDGENAKYHVRGCIVVNGLDAWFVYTGYRLDHPFSAAEQSVAQRSADTFVPGK